MNKVYIGYQGELAVCAETSREIIENDLFLKCDRIEEYEGKAELIGGKILFDDDIDKIKIENAYKSFDALIEKRLNDFAATRRYNSIYTAKDARDSHIHRYAVEGEYCNRMWGETYDKCEELLATYMPLILSGERDIPTWEEIEEQLPKLVWPDEEVGNSGDVDVNG